MITALMAGFAVVLAVVAPRLLAAARWPYRAPRLGILAWQATASAALSATVAAALAALLHYRPTHTLLHSAWRLCLDALAGAHGRAGQATAIAGLGLLAVMLARLAVGASRLSHAARWRRRHRRMLRIVGVPRADLGATVLAHPDPAAYLLPGWPDRVVVTTGALARLAGPELNAVLAHERAHAAGRHHRLCTLAGLLHHAYPRIPVFAHARHQIARLVELCADDTAARTQSPLALARALVTMAEATATPAVLHIGGGHTAERVARLLNPPRRLPGLSRATTAVAFLTLPLTPALVLLLEPLTHLTAFTL